MIGGTELPSTPYIDVWSLETFDEDLLAILQTHSEVLLNYELTSWENYQEQQAADGWVPLKGNPYASDRAHVLEKIIMPTVARRSIRAWHYTRLVDEEVDLMSANGIRLGSLSEIRRRLDQQVSAGAIPTDIANALYKKSPFHHQEHSRSGKFWMVSHPHAVNDAGVRLLLDHWGGEGIFFWLEDAAHIELVQGIGRPRVIELVVPVSVTASAYSAVKAVVSTFVMSLGGRPDWSAFDLYTEAPLDAGAVLDVHTEGDTKFSALASRYPADFSK